MMLARPLARGRLAALVGSFLLLAGCSDNIGVESIVEPQFAPGGGPSVEAANPPEAPQGVTLDVHVIGSGFDDGSAVTFLLAGQSTANILTNSSTFVSRNEVIANVTISADADLALYDIEVVTRRGKKGIGSELFAVKAKEDVDPFYQITTFGNPESSVIDVSDTDVLAGSEGGRAALFELSGATTFLPDFGAESSGVLRISSGAEYAVGYVTGGAYPEDTQVIWDLTAGTMVAAPGLPGLEVHLSDINDAGVAVGLLRGPSDGESWPATWEPTGPGTWSVRQLPSLPQHTHGWAYAINDAGHMVGRSTQESMTEEHAVMWIPNGDGTFDVLDLTPLADGSRGNMALVITEPDGSGVVQIGGGTRIAGDMHTALWTVDLATRAISEQVTTVGLGASDISSGGDVLIRSWPVQVWRPSTDAFYELEHSGSRCSESGAAFDSAGRVFGRAQVTSRNGNGDSCSSERHTIEVAAFWTLIGG